MDKFIGKRLDGRYEFKELIGIGGMANVYKARDIVEDKDVAIKILKEEFLGNEEFVRQFRNESKAVAALSHPNIVRIYDVNFGDKIQYIVMEYIDGVTLKEYIEKANVIDWKDTIHFTVQILRALQHAHDKGIVHRDIKPQNMMLLSDGTIKVMDFGIARFARDEKRSQDKAIGTVHYISPEQASGSKTDAKSDVYSVGIMMYEMLTGRLPFNGKTPEDVAVKQMQSSFILPREINPKIPEGLEEIIVRAMQKAPDKRYQSASEMLRDIDEFKKNPSILFEYKYFNDADTTRYFDVIKDDEKDKIGHMKKKKSKKNKTIPILVGIASGVLLVAIIVLSIFIFGNGNRSVDEIEIPNFIGVKYDDIKTMDGGKYSKLGFKVTQEPNSHYEAGVVFEQYPKAGMKVKENYNDMKVTVSTGSQKVAIPNVKNIPLSDAESKIKAAGFINVTTVEQDSSEITSGYVISTDPKEGTQVATDTSITIYYSNGKGKQVDIPNVVGKQKDEGQSILVAAGFTVSVQNKDDSAQQGTIVEQNPTGKAATGSVVTIYVSTGTKPQKSATVNIPLNSSTHVPDSFKVEITNNSNGKVVLSGIYKVGGTASFTDSGTSSTTYSIVVTNQTTGITANYGTVTVDYGQNKPTISSNLDSSAFSKTVKNVVHLENSYTKYYL